MPLTFRPFEDADIDQVEALHRSVDWPARSRAGWRWLRESPRRRASSPIGWLAQDTRPDRPGVAFVGQFVQDFWLGDEVFEGVTGHSIVVPPALRGAATGLIRKILAQPGALHYTLNANVLAAPLYRRHGMRPWPHETHDVKLAWTVDAAACARGRLLRWARKGQHEEGEAERLMNRRLFSPRPLALPSGVEILTEPDDGAWAGFWLRLRAQGGLLADRSPQMMRWRLRDPDCRPGPLLLVHRRGGEITGALMAILCKMSRIDPPFLDIVDLIALDEDPQAVPVLTRALLNNARAMGAAKVRLQVAAPQLIAALGPLGRRARREGGWSHGHARFDQALDARLSEAWRPTPFDGDYSFCLRSPPVTAAPVRTPDARPSARREFQPAGLQWASARAASPEPVRPPSRGEAC